MEPVLLPIDDEHPLLPAVRSRVGDLADTPPGAAANQKAADLMAFILAMLRNPTVLAVLPVGWKQWAVAAAMFLGGLTAGGVTGRVTAPAVDPLPAVKSADPKAEVMGEDPDMAAIKKGFADMLAKLETVNKIGCQCGCTITGSCVCKDCDHPAISKPATIAKATKIVLFTTTDVGAWARAKKDFPVGVTVDDTVWQIGTKYQFGNTKVLLPCMVAFAGDQVLEVAPFVSGANGAGVIAFTEKHLGKKDGR